MPPLDPPVRAGRCADRLAFLRCNRRALIARTSRAMTFCVTLRRTVFLFFERPPKSVGGQSERFVPPAAGGCCFCAGGGLGSKSDCWDRWAVAMLP